MTTFIIYYIETNLICMMFLAFILYTYRRESSGLTEAKSFTIALIGAQIYCVSDMIAAVFKNEMFTGARALLWAANTIYVIMPLFLAIVWQRYTSEHVRKYFKYTPKMILTDKIIASVSAIIALIGVTTPLTHFAFYLDEFNGYHRAVGAYIVPLVGITFLIYEMFKLQYISRKTSTLEGRQDAQILSIFTLPCILCGVVQVLLYGSTTNQVGFTMGFLIVYLGRLQNKISKDELTGLNNRREYEYALDRMTKSSGEVLIAMIDVDGFKAINDTYGHAEGDQALRTVAKLLQTVCEKCKKLGNFMLCRYGGDEFVLMLSGDIIEDAKESIETVMKETVEAWNSNRKVPYELNLSVGISCGKYNGSEIENFVHEADAEMYRIKKSKPNSR